MSDPVAFLLAVGMSTHREKHSGGFKTKQKAQRSGLATLNGANLIYK